MGEGTPINSALRGQREEELVKFRKKHYPKKTRWKAIKEER